MTNISKNIKDFVKDHISIDKMAFVRKTILNYTLKKLPKYYFDTYKNEIEFMKKKQRRLAIPYSFYDKYQNINCEIIKDDDNDKFIKHNNHNLYFPNQMSNRMIEEIYQSLLVEQDEQSPHCYFDKDHKVDNDVFFDIGTAEGLISLNIINDAKHLYLFEGDKNWKKVLNKTFINYKDKVTIIDKYVNENNPEATKILIDYLEKEIKRNNNIFIKIDIEGEELNLLKLLANYICYKNVKISICVYHKPNDAHNIETYLNKLGFETRFTSKNMFINLNSKNYQFRKGVLYAYFK